MQRYRITAIPQIHFSHTFVSDNYKNRWYGQSNVVEVTYCLSGILHLTVGDKAYHAYPGDVICIGPQTGNELILAESEGHHSHHTVAFLLYGESVESDDPSLPELPLITHVPENASRCLDLIDEIIYCHTMHPDDGSMRCTGLFFQLLHEIGSINAREHTIANAGEFYHVRKAKKYIYEHLYEPILQKDIAAHLGITTGYLSTLFRRNEHCTVMHFINGVKLSRIRGLLETRQVTLAEASALFGYTDPSYVSHLYKKMYGVRITDAIANTNAINTEASFYKKNCQ